MKKFNFIVSTIFANLSIVASVIAIIEKSVEIGLLTIIFGALAYVAWQDYKHPE